MPFVRYTYLETNGIITNRMQLARAIERYGFPKAVALGENTLAWDLAEVEKWVASRPRRAPKTGAKKLFVKVVEAVDSAV
jgi:Prophage CP4-57 regulatory protein (AlpA)